MTENQEQKKKDLLHKLIAEKLKFAMNNQETPSQRFFDGLGRYVLLTIKVAALIFIGVISVRVAYAEFSLSFLQNFTFTELLSLILALFAMLMSILFYFKSTESSNKFYSDTYKFTKDISESIGRIDERFGERLRHLDESYGRMEQRIYSGYSKDTKKEEVEEKKENADNDLKDAREKYEAKINELLEKAKVDSAEKETLKQELEHLQEAREHAAMEVHTLQKRIQRMERSHKEFPDISMPIIHALKNYLPDSIFEKGDISQRRLKMHLEQLPEELIHDLRKIGAIDRNNELTPYGIELIILSRRI